MTETNREPKPVTKIFGFSFISYWIRVLPYASALTEQHLAFITVPLLCKKIKTESNLKSKLGVASFIEEMSINGHAPKMRVEIFQHSLVGGRNDARRYCKDVPCTYT